MGNVANENLTDKQAAFVVEYFRSGFNGAKAAIAAGYAESGAKVEASRLLTNANIVAEIKKRLHTEGITAERIKIAIAEIAFDGDPLEFEAWLNGASMKDLADAGINTQLVKSMSVSETKKGRQYRKIELYDRLVALEKLGKTLALFVDRKEVEHSGQVGVGVNFSKMPDDELARAEAALRNKDNDGKPADDSAAADSDD